MTAEDLLHEMSQDYLDEYRARQPLCAECQRPMPAWYDPNTPDVCWRAACVRAHRRKVEKQARENEEDFV